ncbi:MAG TPA: hypothetical protein VFK02_08310 [Kofleriaceae bacterium]|nr:hypothetical protein [Kofleriaceae bacterium]
MRTLVVALAVISLAASARAETHRTIAGSLQLDYLAVPTDRNARAYTFDGLTAELSLKMSIDFTASASASVKVCFACHGFEAAAAFVDLRAADELSVRIGRLTPEFGSFPQRGDPANHRTNDKPLPYDMGRMLHNLEWNEGILPAPWVDNGVELFGTRFVGAGRVDYAAYVLSGPKGPADAIDFDFVSSRNPNQYYVDNNSEPVVGARLSGTIDFDSDGHGVTLGASLMTGHYDPDRRLGFLIAGADLVASLDGLVIRGEYLARRTDLTIAAGPAARDDHFFKHGFYAEAEVPLGAVDAFARFDGLIRSGAVATGVLLPASSRLLRYTAGAAIRLSANIRLKSSVEYYQFSDFADDVALHLGVATPF